MAARHPAALKLALPAAVGAAVAISIGAYGRLHTPTGVAVSLAGFSSAQTVKVWLACAATFFGIVQLVSALAMYGRLPVAGTSWIPVLHRWSGRVAFLFAVPVALHCLYALGFASYSPRVLLHSVLGCVFFGAFTVKMLALPRRGLPGWALPLLGGLVFAALTALWLSSSLWFFATSGVRF
ncbi:MAG: hypothetical protein J2P15_21915 [Micromonosporaceae bacterium]|nr:hypothetical protein [Micromonosporaceae bacterium]